MFCMKHTINSIILCLGVSIMPSLTAAQNLLFLDDTAYGKFDKQDIALLHSTLEEAAASGTAHETKSWKNDKSGNHGSITLIERLQESGMACAKLKIENFAKSDHGVSLHTWCKTASGEWKTLK